MLVFSILFFITSLCISAVNADSENEIETPSPVKKETIQQIQVQQQEIHKKLVHIEAQLTTRN